MHELTQCHIHLIVLMQLRKRIEFSMSIIKVYNSLDTLLFIFSYSVNRIKTFFSPPRKYLPYESYPDDYAKKHEVNSNYHSINDIYLLKLTTIL